jgi:cytochrome c1
MRDCSFPSISNRLRAGLAFAAASALFLAGCAGTSAIPAPTAKNVEYAGRNGQATTLESLKVGRKLYISRCSACHSLKDPKALSVSEWPEMVDRMASNAKLTDDQKRAITQYLVSVSAIAHDTAPAADAKPASGAATAGEAAPAGASASISAPKKAP